MSGTIRCTSCGQENVPGNFCQSCGKKLISSTVCPRCKFENLLGAKFCRECGIENSALAGIGLARAREWAGVLSRLPVYSNNLDQSLRNSLNYSLKSKNFPLLGENKEVVVLRNPIYDDAWGFTTQYDSMSMPDGVIIWTDWRLIIAGGTKSQGRFVWYPYQHITHYSYEDRHLTLTANRTKLQFHLNRLKPRSFLFDIGDMIFNTSTSNPNAEFQVAIQISDFLDGFYAFIDEVVTST